MSEILYLILHKSLTKYRTKNSKATLLDQAEAAKHEGTDRKGGLFLVRSKNNFTPSGVRGFVVTSMEALLAVIGDATHWTPNTYRKHCYTDHRRKYICGFEENNLQQVNAFVIDIDTKKHSVQDIVLACMDYSVGAPTMVIETPRGYQVYFVLERPIFISNKNNFKSLHTAKRIAGNLKQSLKSVEADQLCNDFGFFRTPRKDNIVFYQKEQTYDANVLINWSMCFGDDLRHSLFSVQSKKSNLELSQSEWFFALLNTNKAKGRKGALGRNNIMFTLALTYYHDMKSKEAAHNLLVDYNSKLQHPLQKKEVEAIIRSAYSGRYHGPKAEYVRELLELHVPNGKNIPVNMGYNYWYKHKKDRSKRVRNHYEEWEQDIEEYITVQKQVSEPFIKYTQKQLCEAVGIPQSTLNELIKKSKRIIRKVSGKGRGAVTLWTTVELLIQHIIQFNKEHSENFKTYVREIKDQIYNLKEENPASFIILNYLEKLFKSPSNSDSEYISGVG